MSGVFGFKQQLRTGQLGEIIFYEAHCNDLLRLDGFKSDFSCRVTGAGTELKTDYYNMEKTPNFFFERFSDRDKGTPGGPWQALANGTKFFCYFFVSNLTYFKFDTAELVEALEMILPGLTATPVQNKSWTTEGYRVPRDYLVHLAEEVKLTVGKKK